MLKSVCGWREPPHDFPNWKTVYDYYRKFRLRGVWKEINECVNDAVRQQEGRKAKPSALIIDSQSVKSAEGGEQIGFDGGKKVHRRTRVLLTDTLGLVMLAEVVAANVHDVYAGARLLLRLWEQSRLRPRLRKIFADGGFRGDLEVAVKQDLHADLDIVTKEEGQRGFQVIPKRWVIERMNAWLSRQRRLARDYERIAASSESFIYIAMIHLGLRRLSHFSN